MSKKIVIFIVIAIILIAIILCGCLWFKKIKSTPPPPDPTPDPTPKTPREVLIHANQLADQQQYTPALQIYHQLIQNKQAPPEVFYYLAELNYANAQNDRDPNLLQAANLYKHAILLGYIDCMVRLADIYNFCTIPGTDIPNKDVAKALYHKIIRSSKASPNVKVTANLRLIELNRDQAMRNMNRTTRIQRNPPPDDQVLLEHNIPNGPAVNVPVRPPPRHNIPNVVRNDSQNVHDRQVQGAFTLSINKLRKLNGYNQRAIPQKDIIQQVKDYVRTSVELPSTVKTKATATLGAIENVNETITSANGLREAEILGLVWNRIHSKENQPNIDNLKEALAHELADATVGTTPVCATGRVTRMINSLEGTDTRDDIVRFRPKWALQEEIQGKAARVRDEILQRATDEERQAYETDGASGTREQNMAQNVTERMKKELLTRCTQEYIEPGLLTKDELNNELATVNEAF